MSDDTSMSDDAKHRRQPERWNAEQFFECAGCGWRGTVADYRRDIRPPALACCPEHNLMPAATIDMAIHEAAELVEVMARAGEEIKRLRARIDELEGWITPFADCPCCDKVAPIHDPGCTFAADAPEAAETMESARAVLFGFEGVQA